MNQGIEPDDTSYLRALHAAEEASKGTPFAARLGENRTWTIEPIPEKVGGKWRAVAYAERKPTEDGDDQGDALTFPDLGDFDTEAEAARRAVEWTTKWIEING